MSLKYLWTLAIFMKSKRPVKISKLRKKSVDFLKLQKVSKTANRTEIAKIHFTN